MSAVHKYVQIVWGEGGFLRILPAASFQSRGKAAGGCAVWACETGGACSATASGASAAVAAAVERRLSAPEGTGRRRGRRTPRRKRRTAVGSPPPERD